MLGLGHLPVAPGSWASAGAVCLWAGLWWLASRLDGAALWLDVFLGALIFLAGVGSVAWGQWALGHFASKDPRPFVLDEAAGQWTALLFLPIAEARTLLAVGAVQFLLFRVLDIVKPPPARQLERLPAGWGVLLDDVASGVYANVAGQVLFRLAWGIG